MPRCFFYSWVKKHWLCYLIITFLLFIESILQCGGFVADTIVYTPQGSKKISELEVGNEVLGQENFAGTAYSQVLFITQDPEMFLIEVRVEGENILASPTQRFFVPLEKRWKAAKNLQYGDLVFSALSKKLIPIQRIVTKELEEVVLLTRIAVAGQHNFLVGKLQILAHNWQLEMVSTNFVLNSLAEIKTAASAGLASIGQGIKAIQEQAGQSLGSTVAPVAAHCIKRGINQLATVACSQAAAGVLGAAALAKGSYWCYQNLKHYWKNQRANDSACVQALDEQKKQVADDFANRPIASITDMKTNANSLPIPSFHSNFTTPSCDYSRHNTALDFHKSLYTQSISMYNPTDYYSYCSHNTASRSSYNFNIYPIDRGFAAEWSSPDSNWSFGGSLQFNPIYEESRPTPKRILLDKVDQVWSKDFPAVTDYGFVMRWYDTAIFVDFDTGAIYEYSKSNQDHQWYLAESKDSKILCFKQSSERARATWIYFPLMRLKRTCNNASYERRENFWVLINHETRNITHVLDKDLCVTKLTKYDCDIWEYPAQIILLHQQTWKAKNGDCYQYCMTYDYANPKKIIEVRDANYKLFETYDADGKLSWSLAEEERKAKELKILQEQELLQKKIALEKKYYDDACAMYKSFFSLLQDIDIKLIDLQEQLLEEQVDIAAEEIITKNMHTKLPENFLENLPVPDVTFELESRTDDRSWLWLRLKLIHGDSGKIEYSDWMVFNEKQELVLAADLQQDQFWQVLHQEQNSQPLFSCDKEKPYVNLPMIGDVNIADLSVLCDLLQDFWQQYGLPLLTLPELFAIDARHNNLFRQNRELNADEIYSIFQDRAKEPDGLNTSKKDTPEKNSQPKDQRSNKNNSNGNGPKKPPEVINLYVLPLLKKADESIRGLIRLFSKLLKGSRDFLIYICEPMAKALRLIYILLYEPHNLDEAMANFRPITVRMIATLVAHGIMIYGVYNCVKSFFSSTTAVAATPATNNDSTESIVLLKTLTKDMAEVIQQNAELKQQNAEVIQQNAQVIQQNAEVIQQNAELKQQNAELKQQNAELKQQNAEVIQQNAEVNKKLENINNKLEANTKDREMLNQTISKLTQEVADLRKNLDENQQYRDVDLYQKMELLGLYRYNLANLEQEDIKLKKEQAELKNQSLDTKITPNPIIPKIPKISKPVPFTWKNFDVQKHYQESLKAIYNKYNNKRDYSYALSDQQSKEIESLKYFCDHFYDEPESAYMRAKKNVIMNMKNDQARLEFCGVRDPDDPFFDHVPKPIKLDPETNDFLGLTDNSLSFDMNVALAFSQRIASLSKWYYIFRDKFKHDAYYV